MKTQLIGMMISACVVLFARLVTQGYVTWQPDVAEGGGYIHVDAQQEIRGDLRVSPYGVQDDLLEWMSDAKYTLDIRRYMITYREVESIMKNLSQMGTQVRLIWENKTYGQGETEFRKLQKRLEVSWVYVTDDEEMGTNFNHTKTLIKDGKHVLISTANATYTSVTKNREYRFAMTHTWVASSLENVFEKDLEGEQILHADIHPSLVVCPINCRREIEQAISSATDSIVIQAQYIQDRSLVDLLRQKSKYMSVQLLVGKWQNDDRLETFDEWVVKVQKSPYNHAKNILIDDQMLIMWSMNLSSNSLDNNREIGIKIDDPRAMSAFRRQFEKDWENGVDENEWVYEED